MPWAAVAGAVISGVMSSSSASDAQDTVGKANALSQAQIAAQQANNDAAFSPYVNTGTAANNRLGYYLGFNDSMDGSFAPVATGSLIDTTHGDWRPNSYLYQNSPEYKQAYDRFLAGHQSHYGVTPNNARGSDELEAEQELKTYGFDPNAFNASQQQKAAAAHIAAQNDPLHGSLLNKFTQNDLNNDVVYNNGLQFGLNEGEKAINRLSAARGGIDSGATLKALTRYANDYGSTKANDAYNRFNTDKGLTYNFLSGQQGVGLNATTQNQGMNNSLVTAGANSNNNAASQQAGYGIQGAEGLNNSIQGGIGNYLYNQRTQAYNAPVTSVPGYSTNPRFYA